MAAKKTFESKMAEAYIPKDVEGQWFDWWSDSGFFLPNNSAKPVARSAHVDPTAAVAAPASKPESEAKKDSNSFVIVLPPPNVTGRLHLGHALTGSVQDAVVRYQRMMGRETLYLPGTDHAGIATQVVVEKRIKAERGLSRHDLGRDKFLEEVWQYKNANADFIRNQLKHMGSSLDWSRARFTMDEQCGVAVREAFVRLFEEGKLYRATRLVNWSCSLQSAISDLEVEYEDVLPNSRASAPGYDKKFDIGQLTHVAYKIDGLDEELVIATTRPETILGDTAIAIHPNDKRYTHLHGKRVKCPFRDATIPIVCDPTLVDMEFGTGAVKVTPAHDPNDFECGQRHNLEQMVMLDTKGFISVPGEFFGKHRFEARKLVVNALEAKGLVRGVEGHSYRVGRCQRSKDIVEPMLMPQWFVDCESMAAASLKAVETKELKLIPSTHETTWNHFLKNIKPWCISRQLWWGHRVPAYEASLNGSSLAGRNGTADQWIVARDVDEARTKAKAKYALSDEEAAKVEFAQDPDVLDTWFSSGLWPFSTMGWPNKTPDLEKFFPGNLLETGHDILFFWVARMVMMSLHFTGKLPFKEVFLHAMVRDKDGEKMSKSKGNVIDPMDVIDGITLEGLHEKVRTGNLEPKEVERALKYQKEAFKDGIPACGSDALRFGLLSYTQSGRSVNLDINRVVGYRAFCNKLWNVTRYILYFALDEGFKPTYEITTKLRAELPLECKWILSRLDFVADECNTGLAEGTYDFALATGAIYRFWIYELCDVFLELTKPLKDLKADDPKKRLCQTVLLHAVERGLRLLHPMMPFVTEELWHRLPQRDSFAEPSIMVTAYPQSVGFYDKASEAAMKTVLDIVHSVRSMKAQYNLTNKNRPDCWIEVAGSDAAAASAVELINAQQLAIKTLSLCGDVSAASKEALKLSEGCGSQVVSADLVIHMMLKGMIDVDKEIQKLDKQSTIIKKSLEGLVKKMGIPNYETKVPADVRKANDEKKEALTQELANLEAAKQRFASMK